MPSSNYNKFGRCASCYGPGCPSDDQNAAGAKCYGCRQTDRRLAAGTLTARFDDSEPLIGDPSGQDDRTRWPDDREEL